jgi:hypothetical protein
MELDVSGYKCGTDCITDYGYKQAWEMSYLPGYINATNPEKDSCMIYFVQDDGLPL